MNDETPVLCSTHSLSTQIHAAVKSSLNISKFKVCLI